MNEIELLTVLKKGLLTVNPEINDSSKYFGHTNPKWKNSLKVQNFYLLSLKNNLYKNIAPKFKLGTGCKAVRSSAALIYNTLYTGKVRIKIDNEFIDFVGYTGKNGYFYEIPFKAIKDDKDSTHTAKLDAGLISTDGQRLLLFEAKCLEWFDKNPKALKKAYLTPERYLSERSASLFIPLFRELIVSEEKDCQYVSKSERYDAIQMLIHMLGIFNWCLTNSAKVPKHIKLINLVWDYKCPEYEIEEQEGKAFVEKANNVLREEFKTINQKNIDFSVEYVCYSDFLKCIDWTNDIEHRKYLERYEIK
ncbi:MAG: hypothetical protein ACI4LX_08035 [Treponema sp.]